MRVLCRFNSGKDLAPDALRRGETELVEFTQLRIGDESTVYGLMFSNTGVELLLSPGESGRPVWFPSGLFEVVYDRAKP